MEVKNITKHFGEIKIVDIIRAAGVIIILFVGLQFTTLENKDSIKKTIVKVEENTSDIVALKIQAASIDVVKNDVKWIVREMRRAR